MIVYKWDSLALLCPLLQLTAEKSAFHSSFHIIRSVCTTYDVSAFQRLYESPDKHFLLHQEWLLTLNFLLFHSFLYIFFFPLYVSNLKFPIFYLSILWLWFLLCLAGILCTLHCPFSVVSEILAVLRMYFPSFAFQRSFLSPFLSSVLGDINLLNSTERQGRTKVKG